MTSIAKLFLPGLLIGIYLSAVILAIFGTKSTLAFGTPDMDLDLDGECLDAAEYPGTCKLWKEGYGRAVGPGCSGDCDFEKSGPKCRVTGRGCGCPDQCTCKTNGKTNIIGEQCSAAEL